MSNTLTTSVNMNKFSFLVTDAHSDSWSESDYETAIELSHSSGWEYRYVLRSPYGVEVAFSGRGSRTSYSIASGYHEGEGDLGGLISRPVESDSSTHVEIVGAPACPEISVELYQRMMSGGGEFEFSVEGIEAYDLLEKARAWERPDWGRSEFASDVALLPADYAEICRFFEEQFLSHKHVAVGKHMTMILPPGLAQRFAETLELHSEALGKNFETRLQNRCNKSTAKLRLRLDELFRREFPPVHTRQHSPAP